MSAKKTAVSPAMQLLELVWQHNCQRSWDCINGSMATALRLAISSGMIFGADDWDGMRKWKPGYWRNNEKCYTLAVQVDSTSALKCLEVAFDRRAIIADNVDNYSQRRLFIGAKFTYGKDRPKVTSFSDDGKSVTACTYKDRPDPKCCTNCGEAEFDYSRQIVEKRFKITRQDIIADRKARKAGPA